MFNGWFGKNDPLGSGQEQIESLSHSLDYPTWNSFLIFDHIGTFSVYKNDTQCATNGWAMSK